MNKKNILSFVVLSGLVLSSCAGKSPAGSSDESAVSGFSDVESASEESFTEGGTAFEITPENTIKMLETTDSFGRYFGAASGFDDGKKVGLFYFLWMGQHDYGCVYDISEMDEYTLKNDTNSVGVFHYWNQPLYGYYDSEDEWVFRKHMELLTMSGIDYIVFDVSNGYWYKDVCDKIFPVALELKEQGWDIPGFIFYCHTKTKDTVTAIYESYFDPETENGKKFASLWYSDADNGERNLAEKPWILVKDNGTGNGDSGAAQNYSECSEEIKNFFYTRNLVWNDESSDEYNFPSDINNPEIHGGMISVSTAQHTSGAFSDSLWEANGKDVNRGRGWSRADNTNNADRTAYGTNFEEEWDYAMSLSGTNNVFVTGWNEWVAQKQPKGSNGRSTCYFVDQFNDEFSRDCDLVAGELGDNYYLQLMRKVREFKETAGDAFSDPVRRTIKLGAGQTQWTGTVGYMDFTGDTADRNYHSSNYGISGNVPNTVYTNTTGRNDIAVTRVTYDNEYLYFNVECAEKITPYVSGDKTWMNIFIEVDGAKGSAWENYQYVLNRTVSDKYSMLERLSKDGGSELLGVADLEVYDKYMTVRVRRELLGLTNEHFTINFKVADHVTNYTDIMDYYVNGDSAPIGRLNYTFKA